MANQYGRDFTVEEIKAKFIKKGYTPMFSFYKNAHEKLLCLNKDGYKVLLSYDKLKQNRNPQPFYINNPYTIDNIKVFILKNKKSDTLVSNTFLEANSKGLDFICENGHKFTMLWRHYKNGSNCPHCTKYKGEERIKYILEEYNVRFEHQKSYDDLLGVSGSKTLSYDFYLPEYNLLIEYQGEQHKKRVEYFHKTKEDFNRQKEHDKRKRQYTKDNNIKLLEIWYYDYDNIEEIIKEHVIATACSFSM